jgi:hypothetical protein
LGSICAKFAAFLMKTVIYVDVVRPQMSRLLWNGDYAMHKFCYWWCLYRGRCLCVLSFPNLLYVQVYIMYLWLSILNQQLTSPHVCVHLSFLEQKASSLDKLSYDSATWYSIHTWSTLRGSTLTKMFPSKNVYFKWGHYMSGSPERLTVFDARTFLVLLQQWWIRNCCLKWIDHHVAEPYNMYVC